MLAPNSAAESCHGIMGTATAMQFDYLCGERVKEILTPPRVKSCGTLPEDSLTSSMPVTVRQ